MEELPEIRAEVLTPAPPISGTASREQQRRHRRRRWTTRLLWLVPILGLSYATSFPGFDVFIGVPSALALGIGALIWIAGFCRGLAAPPPAPGEHTRPLWREWVSPAMALFVMFWFVGGLPMLLRFEAASSDFDALVAEYARPNARPTTDAEDWELLGFERRVGTYDITSVERVGRSLILYEATGDLFDDAGFAYLPDGPDPALGNESFEVPKFVHISGDWYSFTASW